MPRIAVKDHHGKPISNARVREYKQRGTNGEVHFSQLALSSLGIDIPPSDANGIIRLPAMPVGDILAGLVVEHDVFLRGSPSTN